MTFNFDGGDILVILFVAIALVLFRRFDRTGRSLEKVRRYADKSKSDLDSIVAERELSLRDLAVDLEVQEQTTREILSRAWAAREEIVSRTEELEERVERIEAHEKALEELNNLALRVDENLSRLKAESAYVDEVGSRLSEAREKFSGLAEKDKARFESFRQEVTGCLDLDLQAMKSGLEETGRQLAMFHETLETLNARGDEVVGEKLGSFEKELERVEEDFLDRLNKVADEGSRLEDDAFTALKVRMESRTEQLESSWKGGMNRLREDVAATADEIRETLAETRRDMEAADNEYREIEERVHGTSASLNGVIEEVRTKVVGEKLGSFEKELERVEEDFLDRLNKVADEGSRLEDDAFTALKVRMESRTEQLESSWKGGMNRLREDVAATADEIRETLAETRRDMEAADNEYREIEERVHETSASLNGVIEEVRTKVDRFVERKETDLLETLENRQAEYRKTIEERFARIESFIADMDTLAESLRSSQQQTLKEVENTFTAFDAEMTERRNLEKARMEEETLRLEQEMTDLEQELDELKASAYDNVSEKLQMFEDEFFSDLKSRDDQMRTAMEEWRKNVELETAELGLKAGREREQTERRYSTELKQRLTELQTQVFGQFETFQDQVDVFRNSFSGRILGAEEELSGFREVLSDRIAREREASTTEFQRVFEGFEKETDEKFTKAEKTISRKLTDFSREIDTRRKELAGAFDTAREEAQECKERIAIHISEGERSTVESMEAMKSDFAGIISELQDEYSGRTEQLVLESGEERKTLRREISEIQDSVARLSMELTEKSRDSLEALKEQSESFLLEFRKNSREIRDEMERKVKELRQSVHDFRVKSEAHRKEMAAHTDTEYARLMRNLDEIDKRQREFIAETRVFDRADQMKEGLEADIAELNRQLEAVSSGREEIRSVNERYERALSLYKEASGKMARFFSEQQKVDNLEGKIARIGSLSDTVDLKLDRVVEADDSLQDFQVRLKQLEDLHEDLGVRYERLSEKSTVLDAATDGVDRNFERMAKMEEIVKDLAERLLPIREQVSAAEERQIRIQDERAKIDSVVEKVSSLDSTITELDRRLEELGKAREWLARTETRLEEINVETQQHIRLLGTLSKRDGRNAPGSPDMSTREMVVKLARQGWNSEEIARNTKLSRGEVELILELTPKG